MKLSRVAVVLLALAAAGEIRGAQILSRGDLQTLLGGPGTVEDFESFVVDVSSAIAIDCATLNSGAVCNAQGPGLVVPGIDITFGAGGGQWDDAAYFGAPSREILSGSPAGQLLVVDFTTPIYAFGVDLRAFADYPATATVSLFAPDDTTPIGSIGGIALGSDGLPVFAGWSALGGIGRVEFTQNDQPWSPIIDNLEFGTTTTLVPEPATWPLLLAGLAVLAFGRRKAARRAR